MHRPRARLRARRVRRQRPVPDEHRVQARLPGVAAARRSPPPARCRGRARWLPRRLWPVWAGFTAILLLLGAVYPYAGTYARKAGFAASPTLDGLALAPRELARRPGRDRLAARERARLGGRARGGGGGLLGVRPRADLDVHRPPDRARLGRTRGPVGPRAGRPRAGRQDALHDAPTSTRRAALIDRYSVELRRRRPDRAHRRTATPGWRSGTSSATRCSTATAPPSGSCRLALLRTATPACRRWGSTTSRSVSQRHHEPGLILP